MDTAVLEDIGLTGAEIRVFLALLELGNTTAGSVVGKSGLQNAVVHRAFRSLIEKGLVTYVLVGRIRQYQPVEPRLLLGFLDEKKHRLSRLIPELEARRALAKEKPRATVYEGVRGVKELLHLLITSKNTTYHSYGGPHASDQILGTYFWENFHRTRIRRGITARLLFTPSLKWWGQELAKLRRTQVRITQQELEGITETCICGDRVGIIVYLEKPFGFLVDEPHAAESYKRFFQVLWSGAEQEL